MKRITFFTGAGVSAESGLATFRSGSDALWEQHRIEDVCNIDTFEDNYLLVHQFYNQRRAQLADVQPNSAHLAIAKLQQQYPEQVSIMTSNVDDLHERAGSPSVTHLHGFLPELIDLETGEITNIGYKPFESSNAALHYKPNVIFFGEAAPAYRQLYEHIEQLDEDDLVITIGSSEQVIPFCEMAFFHSDGAATVIYVDPQLPEQFLGRHHRPWNQHLTLTATEAFKADSPLMQQIQHWLMSGRVLS